MKKIPVGRTIAHAYRFAFGQFFALVKLIWLPLLLVVALSALGVDRMQSQQQAAPALPGLTLHGALITLITLLQWIVSFMVVTAVFQFALGKDEARGRLWYFSLGKPMWRLLGTFILILAVMVVLIAIYVVAALIILFLFRLGLSAAHISDTALKDIMSLDTALAFLAGYCAFIFCWIRFAFLLGVATIADGRIGLFRSWALSHRNFWRMFAVSIAIFLPLIALELATLYGMGLFPHITPGASPAEMQAAQQAATLRAFGAVQHYWYVFYPALLAVTVMLYGLMAGASVFAWRALTEEPTTSLP